MKLVRSAVFLVTVAACAVEPMTDRETSAVTRSIDEASTAETAPAGVPLQGGGVAQCGTPSTPPCPAQAVSAAQDLPPSCGTPNTPACPAPSHSLQDGGHLCGTPTTPDCPLAAEASQYGGVPDCGTPTTPPCPMTLRSQKDEWQTCGTDDTPPCPE